MIARPLGHLGLPPSVWRSITSYLSTEDLQQLLLVSPKLKDIVLPYLYGHLIFSAWAGAGHRLADAIDSGTISELSVSFVRHIEVHFTCFEEIEPLLKLLSAIKFTGLQRVGIHCHFCEDLMPALHMLGLPYADVVLDLEAKNSKYPLQSNIGFKVSSNIASHIRSLKVAILRRSCLKRLGRLECCEVNYIAHDSETQTFPNIPSQLRMSIFDWNALGQPAAAELELDLTPRFSKIVVLAADLVSQAIHTVPPEAMAVKCIPAEYPSNEVVIANPAMNELKLVANTELPGVRVVLKAPALRALLLCNIIDTTAVHIFRHSDFSQLEFLSLGPVTAFSLEALLDMKLPKLKLVLALVFHWSFESTSNPQRLLKALQSVANLHPLDICDYTGLIRSDFYGSQGLWYSTAQSRFQRFLPRVRPPPLLM